MAVGASLLTTGGSASAVTSISTASVTPTSNRLICVYIVTDNGAPTSVTGNGLTWVQEILNTTLVPIACWRSMGTAPSAGQITINLAANSVISWVVVEYDGVDTSGSNGSGAIKASQDSSTTGSAVTSLTVTLPAGVTAGNAVAAMFINGVSQAMTAGGSYTKLGETTASGFCDEAHEWAVTGTTTPSMSWASSANAAGLAIEIVAATAAAGQQVGGTSTAFHPGRGPSRVARFWQTPRSAQVVPGLIVGGTSTPLHPGRGPSRVARFWQTPRSTSIPAGGPAASGAATDTDRTSGTAAGVKGAAGVAQSGTRTSGAASGVKGAVGASTGQQRTADTTAAAKQATGAATGPQRSSGQPAGRKNALAAAVGQQHGIGATAGVKAGVGAATGPVRTAGVATTAVAVVIVPGRGVATVGTVTGTAIPDTTTGTARVGVTGGTAVPDATTGTARVGNTDGKVSIG